MLTWDLFSFMLHQTCGPWNDKLAEIHTFYVFQPFLSISTVSLQFHSWWLNVAEQRLLSFSSLSLSLSKDGFCLFIRVLKSSQYNQPFLVLNFTKWLESVQRVQWSLSVSPLITVQKLCSFFMPSVDDKHWLCIVCLYMNVRRDLCTVLRINKQESNNSSCYSS